MTPLLIFFIAQNADFDGHYKTLKESVRRTGTTVSRKKRGFEVCRRRKQTDTWASARSNASERDWWRRREKKQTDILARGETGIGFLLLMMKTEEELLKKRQSNRDEAVSAMRWFKWEWGSVGIRLYGGWMCDVGGASGAPVWVTRMNYTLKLLLGSPLCLWPPWGSLSMAEVISRSASDQFLLH